MKFSEWTPEEWYRKSRRDSEAGAEGIRARAAQMSALYRGWLPDLTPDEIVRRLSECNAARLAAVPDTARYPELRGMDALIRAEWRGVRDGAALSSDEWEAWCNGLFYYNRNILTLPQTPIAARTGGAGRCSYVYYPDSDYGPLLANNLDSSADEFFGEPGWPALNEHLLWGTVSSGVFMDETSPEIFPVPVPKLMARYSRSVAEGVEILERYREFWGPCNAILVDREHRVAMIEKSARRIAIRYADGFGFITSMTAEARDFRNYLDARRTASLAARGLEAPCGDTMYWEEADRRRELIARLLEAEASCPTLEGLRRIMQYRAEDGRVAYHGDVLQPGGSPMEFTLRTTIWILRENRALWWGMEGETPSFEGIPRTVNFPTALCRGGSSNVQERIPRHLAQSDEGMATRASREACEFAP